MKAKNSRNLILSFLAIFTVAFSINLSAQWQENPNGIHFEKGNVGIGLDLPTAKLDVFEGRIQVAPNPANHIGMTMLPAAGGQVDFYTQVNGSNSLYFDWNMLPPSDSNAAIIRFFRRTNTSGAKRMDFMRGNNTTAVDSRISVDGGNSFFNRYGGNVGIGAISPSAKLHVDGDVKLQSPNNHTFRMAVENDGDFKFFGDGGVNVMTLTDESARVGIGTSDPTAKLHIDGDVKLQSPNNHTFRMAVENDGDFKFFGDGGVNVMTLTDESARVGIGTSNPATKLDVRGWLSVGNAGDNAQINLNAANNKSARIGVQDDNDQGLYIWTGGAYRMHVNQNGNVGIGTANPSAKLHVDGDLRLQSTNNHTFGMMVSEGGDLKFLRDGGNTAMIIGDQTGSVGIGSNINSVPAGYRLAVDGKVRCREVRVTNLGWADFVFADDYALRPLEEVEQFIRNNKHLPDVPSEAEVLENGTDLGNMDAILLQKIEELTLYMIQLKKENEVLRTEMTQLQGK